ncbi:hypothetical protein B1748_25115 [Paenibacillus sp. MY03]|uniref:aldo/keto reductase n=1 Tax=Paenibacillus sp. MY03 TaxID=302980 RepID=UPI000B3C3363|nr:aldo/keto reductase [Paenibacillus sp. MY03]OUS72142.1 hypothetical protein B1748_25115 [Paenibacillus sp. MY03]
MIKQTMYKTDLHVSVICLGTALLGDKVNEKESFRLLDSYVDLGGNFLDTALAYGGWSGPAKAASEKTIGKWLKLNKRHGRIIVGTKGACPTTERFFRLSRTDILSDLHNSLENLQTDCLDLYWLHRDDPARPVEEVIDLLNEQVQAGKIRYFGCSNWTLPRIQAAQTYAEQHNKQGFCANQPMWSLAQPNLEYLEDQTIVHMDNEMKKYHELHEMPAIPFASQAGGFFSGRYRRGEAVHPDKDCFSKLYYNEKNFNKLERVLEVARQYQKSPVVIALSYLLSQPFAVFPIIGSYTTSQLTESCAAGDFRLDADTWRYIDGI